MNFTPSPGTTQPSVIPFTPATPAALKNVGQYQAPTLGSQLYPVHMWFFFIFILLL